MFWMIKRMLSLLLAIILSFPLGIFAEGMQPEGEFNMMETSEDFFQFDENTGTITGYTGTEVGVNVVIPETIRGVEVKKIGDYAFRTKFINSVIIPSSVTEIGVYAFQSNRLEDITIPNSVNSIGSNAFQNNQLTSIDIPESVTQIANLAFAQNQIKHIVVRNSIAELHPTAFNGNPVQSISIPRDVDNSDFLDSFMNLFPSTIIITDENSPAHTLAENKGRSVQLIGKTVTFDLMGGEGHFSSQTVKLGEPLVEPEAIPTKEGAVFKNWRINPGSVYDFRNVVEDITIFAEWEETIPDTATIVVNHIDMDTNNVLETETLTEELGIHTVNAKEIAGYTLADATSKQVTLTTKDEEVTVEFKYKKDLFEFDQSTGTITNYIGTEKNVVIPETMKGVSVVKIGDAAFKEKQLQSVIIPNSITVIGNEAFSHNQLKEVAIPNSVTSIGDKAFEYNHLENVTLADSVASIGNYAFMANVLTDITIPTSLTKLNVGVFTRNQLKNVTIPSNVTSIEDIAFFSNPLELISIPSSTTYIHKTYDTLPNPAIIIAEENSPAHTWATEMGKPIQLVGKTATYNLNGGQGDFPSHTVGFGNPLVKPEATPTKENAYFWYWRINLDSDSNYDFRSVTEDITIYAEWEEILPDRATIYVSHKDVDTNEELAVETLTKELGTHTVHSKEFAGYILVDDASKEVTLYAKDNEILVEFKYKRDPFEFDEGTGTITGYTGIELNVVIPDMIRGVSVVKIGDEAFKNKELQSVVLPTTIESIGDYAFYGNELQSVILPTNLISIGDNGFGDNQLRSVVIPNSVTSIGNFAFYDNILEEVHIPDGVTIIGIGAFQQNKLETVTIPNSITVIENVAFAQNQLQSVVIPESVTNIKGQAFAYNQLQSVAIPESVTSIGREAFANNQLKNIIIPNGVYSVEMNAFNDNPLEYISISRYTGEIENAYATIPSTAIVITEQDSLAHIWAKDKGMAIQLVGKTATYNLNGGEGDFPSHPVRLGEPLVKPEATPTKVGAFFKNWRINLDTVYDFRNITEDITIFAEWEEIIPDTATIIVNHIDMDTNNVLETETLTEELGTHTVNSKEIAEYTLVDAVSKEVTLFTKDETVIVEFKYKKNPSVESVKSLVDIAVDYGTSRGLLSLPPTVEVTLSDETTENLGVTWDNGNPTYDGNTAGEYTFTGTLSKDVANPQNLTAQVKVVVKAKPTKPDIEAPTWPNGSVLTVSDITQTSVKLSWPWVIDNVGVTGYRLYVDSIEYQTVTSSVNEQIITGLKAGTTYTFTIKAFNDAGIESEPLNTKAMTAQFSSGGGGSSGDGGGSGGSPTPPAPKKPKEPVSDPGEINRPPVESTVTFLDIAGHWAESYIKQALAKGIVGGYPDGTFKPNHRVTRAEFIVMLANALKLEDDATPSTFSDNKHIGAWAKQAIDRAVQAGIITGYDDGSFRPSAPITRTEMAVMFARAMDLQIDTNEVSPFADDKAIPSWAKGAVDAVHRIGIVNGRGENRFVPNGTATRAEATAMLIRMLEKGGN